MNQGARHQQPPRFARRQFVQPSIRKMRGLQASHGSRRRHLHFRRHMMVRPNADRSEETGKHQFAPCDIARALRHQIVADDS